MSYRDERRRARVVRFEEESLVAAPQPPRIVIDHLRYPQIINRILKFATTRTLLAFGFTNSAYTKYCHELIGRHLILRGTGHGVLSIRIQSIRGEVPRFARIHIHVDNDELRIAADQGFKLFRLCRVLDVFGDTHAHPAFVLSPWLVRLRTLRIRDGFIHGVDSKHQYQYPARVTVVFGSFPVSNFSIEGSYRWNGCGFHITTFKLVWRVTGLHISPYHSHHLSNSGPSVLVLHFRFYDSTKPAPYQALHYLIECIRFAVRKYCNITVKIVDFDLVPLASLNFEHAPARRLLERQLRFLEELGVLAYNVSFLNCEEYAAQYGQEQYTIETCEELW